MEIIDISNWTELEDREASGTREKAWYKNNGKTYLFKYVKSPGEAWAEKIASDVGNNIFHVPVAKYYIAKKDGVIGCLSENVVDSSKNEELYEISDLMCNIHEDFDSKNLAHYNIKRVLEIVEGNGILPFFYDMCLFDFIIVNQDRHCENWGIIRINNSITPSPLYDNGSSLGNNLSEKDIQIYLGKDANAFAGFNRRTKTQFTIEEKKKPKAKKLITYLYKYNYNVFKKSSYKFVNFNASMLDNIIKSIPYDIMSESQKKFVSKLLFFRINMVRQFVDEGGNWYD